MPLSGIAKDKKAGSMEKDLDARAGLILQAQIYAESVAANVVIQDELRALATSATFNSKKIGSDSTNGPMLKRVSRS